MEIKVEYIDKESIVVWLKVVFDFVLVVSLEKVILNRLKIIW